MFPEPSSRYVALCFGLNPAFPHFSLQPVYEGVNLSSKKAFIKEAACAYISVKHTQTPAAAEGAPEKCGGEDDEMAQAVEESASETAAAAGPTADAPVEEAAGMQLQSNLQSL